MKKKWLMLFIVSLVLVSGFSMFVGAQESPVKGVLSIVDKAGIGDIFDIISFDELGRVSTATNFVYFRLILFLLFYGIFFGGAELALKQINKGARVMIAVAFALIGSIVMPKNLLVFVIQSWGIVLFAVLVGVLLVGGIIIAKKIENSFARGIIYVIAGFLLMGFTNTIASMALSMGTRLTAGWASWLFDSILPLVAFILMVIGMFDLFRGIGAGRATGGIAERVSDFAGEGGGGMFGAGRGARDALRKTIGSTEKAEVKLGKRELMIADLAYQNLGNIYTKICSEKRVENKKEVIKWIDKNIIHLVKKIEGLDKKIIRHEDKELKEAEKAAQKELEKEEIIEIEQEKTIFWSAKKTEKILKVAKKAITKDKIEVVIEEMWNALRYLKSIDRYIRTLLKEEVEELKYINKAH